MKHAIKILLVQYHPTYLDPVPKDFESRRPERLGVARAIESGCYFVYCNWAGRQTAYVQDIGDLELSSTGDSMVIDPFGRIVARAKSTHEETLLVTLDRRLRYDPPGLQRG